MPGADGSDGTNAPLPGSGRTVAWSPDSRRIVYVSLRDGAPALWQYDFTTESAIRIAGQQLARFELLARPVDQAFEPDATPEEKSTILAAAFPDISADARLTLQTLAPERWAAVRAEASRVLDATERSELRDSDVEDKKAGLSGQMAGGLDENERMLAAERNLSTSSTTGRALAGSFPTSFHSAGTPASDAIIGATSTSDTASATTCPRGSDPPDTMSGTRSVVS